MFYSKQALLAFGSKGTIIKFKKNSMEIFHKGGGRGSWVINHTFFCHIAKILPKVQNPSQNKDTILYMSSPNINKIEEVLNQNNPYLFLKKSLKYIKVHVYQGFPLRGGRSWG